MHLRLMHAMPYVLLASTLACGGGQSNAPSSVSPPPTSSWGKAIGGTQNDNGYLALPIESGTLVIGTTRSFGAGGTDAWILKLDPEGGLVSQVALGGSGDDAFNDARSTPDGGFILAGTTTSFGAGGTQGWLVKLNADLTISWEARYAPDPSASVVGFTTVLPIGNQFVALGSRSLGGVDSALLVVVSALGGLQTQTSISAEQGSRITSAMGTPDNGLILAGEVVVDDFVPSSTPYSATWYARLNPDLQTFAWSNCFTGVYTSTPSVVRPTSDGGAIMVGSWAGFYGFSDCWVVKLNRSGVMDWITGLGGGNGWNSSLDVIEAPDHTFLLAASTNATFSSGGNDLWLVRMSTGGAALWQKTYGTTGIEGAIGAAVWMDPTGQHIFAVTDIQQVGTGSDLWLLKAESDGTCSPFSKASTGVVYSPSRIARSVATTSSTLSGQLFTTSSVRTNTAATFK
jgi:hypothetical protein